jgi:hypothetical protein
VMELLSVTSVRFCIILFYDCTHLGNRLRPLSQTLPLTGNTVP